MGGVLLKVFALIPQPELQLVTTLPHLGEIFGLCAIDSEGPSEDRCLVCR